MAISNKKEPILLFIGDILIFALSLMISLLLRGTDGNFWATYAIHIVPFSIIFIAWILVFFIAGLYDKYTTILKEKISSTIFYAQFTNSAIAVTFFYLIPYFGITPKTVLFIDLVISLILIYGWRIYSHRLFGLKRKEPAIIVGSGEDMKTLEKEVNENPRSELEFVSSIDLDKVKGIDFVDEIADRVYAERIGIIVVDLKDERVEPILPHLYNLIFSGVRFIDMYKVYEDVFDREPLSLVRYNWFLENLSFSPKFTYDALKRFADIIFGIIGGIISLIFYPLVMVLLLCDEGHGFFSIQERIGKDNKPIKMYKFRTMKIANDAGKWNTGEKNYVTKIGAFLRKTRLDELPQFWNVILGDVSLIGPRPEFPDAVKTYEKEIPYYDIRYLIKPGLSGWAQIYHDNHPHHGIGIAETKEKLSYDLYYIKNRSFMLDMQIGLKTIKKLLSIAGK